MKKNPFLFGAMLAACALLLSAPSLEAQGADRTPTTAQGYFERGNAYYDKGDLDLAIADYEAALRLNPNHAQAKEKLADVRDDLEWEMIQLSGGLGFGSPFNDNSIRRERDKAIADNTEAIRRNPNNAEAYYKRGYEYDLDDDYDKAIADFTEAIRLNPAYGEAYYGRGGAYRDKGDNDRAIADFEAALRIPGFSLAPLSRVSLATVYNRRGDTYYDKKDYNRAIADYEAALRNSPNFTRAKENLANARRARGY